MAIYDALRESHRIQRGLCRRLLRTASQGADRRDCFTLLRAELMAHAAAEERFLYSPLLMLDGGLASSRHALAEHHQTDELLEDLAVRDMAHPGWLRVARKLSEKVHHHLREEEKKFFQVSGRLLHERQKQRLEARYRRDYARLKRVYLGDHRD